MARLTRVQQRARTRAAILAAARQRFLAVGYAAASLDEIAEDAGYSKGAVYSNFLDKPTLCREVLEEIHADKLGELAELASGDRPLEDRLDAVSEWIDRTVGDVGWTMLELEFVIVSRNDPPLAAMVVELRRNAQRMVVRLIRLLFDDGSDPGGVPDEDLDGLADLLLSTGIGLGIQRAVDPSIEVAPTVAVLRAGLALLGGGADSAVVVDAIAGGGPR